MSGFIKLHRSLKDWQWYDDHNATRMLIHLLVSVNYEDKKWKGITIEKGSYVCSWDTLSKGCGLSVQQCRTNVKKLIDCGELTRKVTNKYQVLSLVKWDKMQIKQEIPTSNPTNNQQSNNNQITTTKETKENIYRAFGHLELTDLDFNKLLENYTKAEIDGQLDSIENYSKNKNYKSLYLTCLNWLKRNIGDKSVDAEIINWDQLVLQYNNLTGKKSKFVTKEAKKRFISLINQGYTKNDIWTAMVNCANDSYHKETEYIHFTLDFISRPDKLEKFLSRK